MLKIERVVAAALAGVVVSGAAAQDAVQWRVEDGGNGHWYWTPNVVYRWTEARAMALGLGGDLASLEANAEREWARALRSQEMLLGGVQLPGAGSPDLGWVWLTGESVDGPLICDDSPCGCCPGEDGDQDYLHFRGNGSIAYGDVSNGTCGDMYRPLIEWSADCNDDGIVDYGQILDGTFADTNGNGVPDCCEGLEPCLGDLNGDDAVGPPDLGILLAVWGTDGGKIGGADLNGDGTVNAADLGLLIVAWGQCGCN